MKTSTTTFFVCALTNFVAHVACAGTVTIPNTFSAGTAAKAADVNANFNAVANAVNGNAQDIATIRTTVQNIPAGPQGPAGSAGSAGIAATVQIGTVTTGAPGTSASVTNVGTMNAAVLNFTIPRGASGTSISVHNLLRVTIQGVADNALHALVTVPNTATNGYLLRQVTSGVGTCYLVTGSESIPIASSSITGLAAPATGLLTPFAPGEALSVTCISSGLTNNTVPMSFVFDTAGSASSLLRVTIQGVADNALHALVTVPNTATSGYLLRQVTSGAGICYLIAGSESIPIASSSASGLAASTTGLVTPFAPGESLSVTCISSGLTNNTVPMSFVFDTAPP